MNKVFAGSIFVVVILGGIALLLAPFVTSETVTIKVVDKERIVGRDGESSKYLVFTETEVFENTDCLVLGKFNSSDVYGQIEIGETYRVQVYGWRIPLLSMYRNIVKIL